MTTLSRYANGNARRKAREWLKSQALPCHLCGRAIDYGLPAGDPMSFEVDEIVPVSRGGSPYDRGNIAPAHRICNERRGNRPLKRMPRFGEAGPRDFTAGHGEEPAIPGARMSDIRAAIADVYGPRPCDLGTEDASWF